MTKRGEVLDLQPLLEGDVEVFPQLAEEFGLFDRIDAEIGLHVEVEFEHLLGIPRLLDDEREDGAFDLLEVGADPLGRNLPDRRAHRLHRRTGSSRRRSGGRGGRRSRRRLTPFGMRALHRRRDR